MKAEYSMRVEIWAHPISGIALRPVLSTRWLRVFVPGDHLLRASEAPLDRIGIDSSLRIKAVSMLF
jgi:hypothetical protein